MQNIITVPAEKWTDLTRIYSGMEAIEQHYGDGKTIKPVRVKSKMLDSRRYTAFGICHGGLEGSYIDAWEMVPEGEYGGATTLIYHDEAAIEADQKRRGDHEGLIVIHKGARYVLTRPLRIEMSLPSPAAVVSMEEARRYDREAARYGWRALFAKGYTPTWSTIVRFPVVSYRSTRGPVGTTHILFYRYGKNIEELRIDDPMRHGAKPCIEAGDGQIRMLCSVALHRRMTLARVENAHHRHIYRHAF